MPFYLLQARYSQEAVKAMVAKPSDRKAAAAALAEAAGATLHHFFFAFGEHDVVALFEAPDDTKMAAALLAVGASGALASQATTRLITMEDAMAAMEGAGAAAKAYKPPMG
jgi:uncharacterized protein with GYD domain